ncbi:DUF1992 domain-containing protein [Desulfosporosinus youngiae]|uniref:DnaJ family domain-containing protein n=1 Tax=Desulfosporosinus youngiae TaxID=339862 RepID=UPI0002D72AB8|nr:DUF1992 domain-containing protein [Desulfosporosinus youngiae]
MVERGEFTNLPGEGKPLKLEPFNPYVSKEQVIMNKVLNSSGLIPIEILILKAIDEIKEKLKDSKLKSEQNALKVKLNELEITFDIQMEARRNFFDNS